MSGRARGALVAIGAILVVAVVAGTALVLTRGSASSSRPPIVVAPAAQRFPNPPADAFVTARADGADVLALAVVPLAKRIAVQVSDVTQDGVGASGLRVSFAVMTSKGGTGTRTATACGAGCYHASVPLGSRPLAVRVRVVRPGRVTSWKVALPTTWPATDASTILARATRTWKQLRSLSWSERLSSDATHTVLSDWRVVAPDRLSYRIRHEGQAVIVGPHRWDRQVGGGWVKSSALRLHQPVPFWVSATDAHVIDSTTLRGHAVWRVSFFDPRTPGWFLVAIDRASYRTLDVRMTAAAHFMHDSYGGFNTSIKIVPPSSG
jgi:hypothetical protein